MSKKRVGLYMEEDVWGIAKDRAWRGKVSLSSYIEGLISGGVTEVKDDIPQNDDGMSLRERYKLSHPRELCPQCRERNRDCKC